MPARCPPSLRASRARCRSTSKAINRHDTSPPIWSRAGQRSQVLSATPKVRQQSGQST